MPFAAWSAAREASKRLFNRDDLRTCLEASAQSDVNSLQPIELLNTRQALKAFAHAARCADVLSMGGACAQSYGRQP
jgi:hypothetical protein